MKRVVGLALATLLILGGCKEYKTTECTACGKTANCYKVTWVRQSDGYVESHFVCSKKCEDDLNVVMNLGGAVKK